MPSMEVIAPANHLEITGACLCGAVSYVARERPRLAEYCHCAMCRKSHGAAFSANAALPAAKFALALGEDAIITHRSSLGRERCFCRHCGSSLFLRRLSEPEQVVLHLGGLRGDFAPRPERHVFVGSKAPWYPLRDALPRFSIYPGFEPTTDTVAAPGAPAAASALEGSCLCGQVGYTLPGRVFFLNHCHCSRCRRFTGSAFGSYLHAAGEGFAWTRGAEYVTSYESSPGNMRAFCQACGGKLPVLEEEGSHAIVPAGSLDTDPAVTASAQFFCGSKAPWFEISDPAPCYDAFPPGAFWEQWD
ncbi:hypothetical protein BURK2_03135 [Burkholderiales bacterium]|nr:MAG: GFA family protein [Burkholderiales bacterium]CAG1002354.1 hypothetical protein BURK2_03135 [Burkholderiales bacterium]